MTETTSGRKLRRDFFMIQRYSALTPRGANGGSCLPRTYRLMWRSLSCSACRESSVLFATPTTSPGSMITVHLLHMVGQLSLADNAPADRAFSNDDFAEIISNQSKTNENRAHEKLHILALPALASASLRSLYFLDARTSRRACRAIIMATQPSIL